MNQSATPASIILASASPRRREILTAMGLRFEVQASEVDESKISADHPRTFALRAAFAKANDVAARVPEGAWVLAADTVVTMQMVLYGKPADDADARRMLRALSGHTHEVITAIALVQGGRPHTHLRSERTAVSFRTLTETDIESYIRTGEPFDKAGAYGIQGHGGGLVERIQGDFFNVVGLPCGALVSLMEEAGVEAAPTVPVPPERWR
jgi:septum formation protein